MKKSTLLVFFTIFVCLSETTYTANAKSNLQDKTKTIRRYLSGRGCDDMKEWEFFCTSGRKSGEWTTIGVPSCWEMQGFGTLQYGYMYDRWYGGFWKDTQRQGKAARTALQAKLPPKAAEHGLYRTSFFLERALKDRCVFIVFEGVMTDATVRVNGRMAGPTHQGGFYRFSYDITELIDIGKDNYIEVDVAKESGRKSVNDAERHGDYWNFGGIFRPVYIEILPKSHLYDVSINAHADFSIDVNYKVANAPKGYRVEQEVIGEKQLWTAETPHLSTLRLKLVDKQGRLLHQTDTRFGYRSFEVRQGDGCYLNGKKIQVRGVNRHSFRGETGRTLSPRLNTEDVKLIKAMNMNAVRLAHYPADKDFLDACDSLGLYVMDELCSWQMPLDTEIGTKLATEMITYDRNHPCILWWSNGNEGGWNEELDTLFFMLDPQHRPVIHPWGITNGIDTKHYRNYDETRKWIKRPYIYMPTEFQHGLYDGGLGAGLKSIWELMMSSKRTAGGFLWVLGDEGVITNDTVDCAGNLGPDGIVGPRHELGGSYYTIREVWSPIQISNISTGNGKRQLLVKNEYDFTDFDLCKMEYEYVDYDKQGHAITILKGILEKTAIKPHEQKNICIPDAQADALRITVNNPYGEEIFTWAYQLQADCNDEEGMPASQCPLKTEPRFFAVTDNDSIINIKGRCNWQIISEGKYLLDYDFDYTGNVKLMGLSFDYPEKQCTGKQWLGKGPTRVWQNRIEGPQYGFWQNSYNNTRPGISFDMPEFKGYFDDVTWMEVAFTEYTVRLEPQTEDLFVGVFTPQDGLDNYLFNLPETGLSILHVIPAIGNKINGPEKTGPQGKPKFVEGRHCGRIIIAEKGKSSF